MKPPTLIDRFLTAWGRRGWRGFLTLRRLCSRPTLSVLTRYGAVLELHPEDHIDHIVLREGYYEPEVFAALQPFLKPGAVLWDIGANFGQHAITAALVTPGLQVHAFEPNPAMLARLKANTRHNNVTVHAWPCALADRDGTATLHVNASGNPGMTTLTPWAKASYSQQIEVPLARAESIIGRGEVPAPNAIKLDVEGAEPAVLAGLGSRLRDPALQAIVFETRADLLADPQKCPAARLLQSAGFGFRALACTSDKAQVIGNFLALRMT